MFEPIPFRRKLVPTNANRAQRTEAFRNRAGLRLPRKFCANGRPCMKCYAAVMASFPQTLEQKEFRAWRSNLRNWLPIVSDIANGLSLPHQSMEVFSTGTNLVVGLDEKLVLKIYPPFLRRQHFVERATLPLLNGRTGVSVPELIADGERDGWPFLVMSRLPGQLGANVWPTLPEDQAQCVLRQIAKAKADCQALRVRPPALRPSSHTS